MIMELGDEQALDVGVSLSLRKNPLSDDGTLIPQVSARKANIKIVLTEIEKENSNVKASLMRYHLKLYQEKLLDLLKMGYDVKVLDLAVLHIKAKGLVRSASEAAELSDFTVRFTPTGKTLALKAKRRLLSSPQMRRQISSMSFKMRSDRASRKVVP